jgi:hypothetical protein
MEGTDMARAGAKKTAPRRPAKAPAKRPAPAPAAAASAPAAVADLAGGLRTLLDAVEGEVRAVSVLSEQIDALVAELNALREDQAQRLLALDELRALAKDGGLSSFLDKLVRPRMPRVPEVVPERLVAQ